jgi:hypothetical protein
MYYSTVCCICMSYKITLAVRGLNLLSNVAAKEHIKKQMLKYLLNYMRAYNC